MGTGGAPVVQARRPATSAATTGLVYGVSTGLVDEFGTLTAGSGFTARFNFSPSPSTQMPLLLRGHRCQYDLADCGHVDKLLKQHMRDRGAAYKCTIPPIYPNPSHLPANHANPITITLTGTGTSWSGATVFTVTGDATLVGSNVTSATNATLTVATGSATGSATISGGTLHCCFDGGHCDFVVGARGHRRRWIVHHNHDREKYPLVIGADVSPAVLSLGRGRPFGLQHRGHGQHGGQLQPHGRCGNRNRHDHGQQHYRDGDRKRVCPCASIAVAPTFIPASSTNITLTLTGTNTTWSGNPFILSGVAGVTLVSQTVTSHTAATIVVSTGTTTGTVTLSDGSYTTTIAVIPAAVVSTAYVGRSGMAYFLTGTTTDTYAPPQAVPTFSVTGTSVTNGGSGYAAPTAAITGGIAITLTNGGSGYTSAPWSSSSEGALDRSV